jgi:hypothetical protein
MSKSKYAIIAIRQRKILAASITYYGIYILKSLDLEVSSNN